MIDHIGEKIQTLRKQKNMTITALAKNANISRSLISQIESSYTYPSLQTLEKIVQALDISLSDFFKPEESEKETPDFVVRSNKRKMLYLPDSPNDYYLLSQYTNPNFEFLLTDYHPFEQGLKSEESFQHEGRECFYVLEGQIHLTVDEQTVVLNAGDSGCFDSTKTHCYRNKSNQHAKLIVVSINKNQ